VAGICVAVTVPIAVAVAVAAVAVAAAAGEVEVVVVVVVVVGVVVVVVAVAVAVAVGVAVEVVVVIEHNCKIGYRLESVGVSVRSVHELSRTICLVFSKRKLGEVAVYSPVCSCCCRNKHPTADYCGNMLESRGIGAGSSPIGCESVLKASKVQCSSLLLWSDTQYMYIYIYPYG